MITATALGLYDLDRADLDFANLCPRLGVQHPIAYGERDEVVRRFVVLPCCRSDVDVDEPGHSFELDVEDALARQV
jgi:hypothetical protein